MKSVFSFFLFLAALLFLTTGFSTAQESNALDTIIKVEGKILPVNITTVTTTYVRFKVPGSDELFTMSRKEIHKIIYKNGRIEDYNQMAVVSIDETAWQAVWLTEDPAELTSLFKRGSITAKVPPSERSAKAAKKNATIQLQKKAAAMKGTIVFVTKKEFTGAYGELQGYYIEGDVYGPEPPDEDMVEKANSGK